MTLSGKRVLLIIGGGIAAYKALDLIRRLRERGAAVRPVMTTAAQQFVTPLSVGALSADHVFTDLFDRQDEQDVGHIRLARDTDAIVVAPATADLMGKLANGLANDLASAVLLATTEPVLMAPAMNPRMWAHPAMRRNRATLERTASASSGRQGARWPKVARRARAAWPSRWRSSRPSKPCSTPRRSRWRGERSS